MTFRSTLIGPTFSNDDAAEDRQSVSQTNKDGLIQSLLKQNGSKETLENGGTSYCHTNDSGVGRDRELNWNNIDEDLSSPTANGNSLQGASPENSNKVNREKRLHLVRKFL